MKSIYKKVWNLFSLAFFCYLILISNVAAQRSSPIDGFTPSAIKPGSPSGSYALSNFETVNPYNGKLNLGLPLISIGGRGELQAGTSLRIDRTWMMEEETLLYGASGQITQYFAVSRESEMVVNFGLGKMERRAVGSHVQTCQRTTTFQEDLYTMTATRLVFSAPDGTEYELRDIIRGGEASFIGHCAISGFNRGRIFASADGTSATFVSDADIIDPINAGFGGPNYGGGVTGYLYLKNGIVYRVESNTIQWVRDRNGNKMTMNQNVAQGTFSITDSVGRQVTVAYHVNEGGQYGICDKISYSGSGGAGRIVRACKTQLANALRPGTNPQSPLFTNLDGVEFGNPEVFSALWLPNGQKYNFQYNEYGELARIDLPTGGAIEYDYAKGLTNGLFGGVVENVNLRKNIYRRIIERREYADGVNLTTKTTYSRPESVGTSPGQIINQGYVEVKQFDQNNIFLSGQRHFYNGVPVSSFPENPTSLPEPLDGKEWKTETLQSDGATVLTRTTQDWQLGCGVVSNITQPHVSETINTLVETNQVSKQTFEYDCLNNLTDTYEYDFGTGAAGPFKRRTHTDYVADVNYTSATGAHIRALPLQTWVSSDVGGANRASLMQFEYDNYSGENNALLFPRSNVVGHDITNYGTNKTIRGNVTRVKSYGNAQIPTEPVSVYSNYDILGNVVKTIDAKNNPTTIDYTDRFGAPDGNAQASSPPPQLNGLSTFAFPTSATNALGWVTGYSQVDFFTGQAVDVEDINGVVSSMFYEDLLDRPTKSIAANNQSTLKRQTRIVYDDTNRKVTTFADLSEFGDDKLKSESIYDGLGRTVQTVRYESDGNNITVDSIPFAVVQDPETSLWRTAVKSSNPYRAGEPIVWTTSLSDSLGRGIKVITPDGAIVKTAYSGNTVTVTDQAGKQRRSITNGLGQLIRVDEPDNSGNLGTVSAPVQPTSYGYDILNNLLTVSQIGTTTAQCGGSTSNCTQTRTFTYNSLSRLLSASNPESGTINYVFDNNGNLTTKTDARGVQTDYVYDALNRVTNRNYSTPGGIPANYQATANVIYTYDDPNIANAKGLLTKVTNGFSTTEYQQFDQLGRVLQSRQATDGTFYDPMTYAYNLSGAMVEQKYPSGKVVKNVLDNDGDLSIVQSKKNANSGYFNYAKNFTYTAAGAVSSMQLGNGKWESTQFNSRLQPIQIALGTVRDGTDKLKLDYSYGTTNNNGNVQSQTITVPTTGNTAGFTAIQTYNYDSLNRLKDASETIGGIQSWKQTFSFDRYGNRRFDEANTTTIPAGCQTTVCNPTIDPNTNKLIGYQFDNSGNTKTDAENRTFVYDAENKQVEVRDASNNVIGQYAYDGDGKRVKKVSATEITIFVYDAGGKMVAEYSTLPNPTPQVSYLTTGHLGSPRINTDENGKVIARHDFQPFGEEIQRPSYGTDDVRQKFTSYERDKETDLDFAQARMHSYNHGRFTSPDPYLITIEIKKSCNSRKSVEMLKRYLLHPSNWNKYVYAINNPLRFVDPTGQIYLQTSDGRIHYIADNDFNEAEFSKEHGDFRVVSEGTVIRVKDGTGIFAPFEGKQVVLGATGVLPIPDGVRVELDENGVMTLGFVGEVQVYDMSTPPMIISTNNSLSNFVTGPSVQEEAKAAEQRVYQRNPF